MPDADTARYRVMLLNDDETPMDVVIHALERFFGLQQEQANELMLRIHNEGIGECGLYPEDAAKQKVADIRDFARRLGFPLQCVMEKVA